jgi:hypothetical protein
MVPALGAVCALAQNPEGASCWHSSELERKPRKENLTVCLEITF